MGRGSGGSKLLTLTVEEGCGVCFDEGSGGSGSPLAAGVGLGAAMRLVSAAASWLR